jgi:hypothetical protein
MLANQSRKSRFITILSIVSIMAALYSIVENISTLSMQSSPEFQIARQLLPSAFISSTTILIEITLNIAAIIASIGLFMRLNWGRIMYMVVLSLFTVWEIYLSISSYMALNALLTGYGLGSSLSLIVFWSVLGVGINIFLIWKLSSDNIRFEFDQSNVSPH